MIQSPFFRILGSAADPCPILYKSHANWRFLPKIGMNPFMAGQIGGISHQQLGSSADCPHSDAIRFANVGKLTPKWPKTAKSTMWT